MGKAKKGHGDEGSSQPDENVSGIGQEQFLQVFQRATTLEAKTALYSFLLDLLEPYAEKDGDKFIETPRGMLVKVIPREVVIDVKRELANKRIEYLEEYNKIVGK